jgi:lipid A 3-O-deacylase
LFKTFSIATDTIKKLRILSSLSTGIIGPAAGVGEIQTEIHKKPGDFLPLGWHNQISNYPVLNYQVRIEKKLLALGKLALLLLNAPARLGTLNSKASLGGLLMISLFNHACQSVLTKKTKFRFINMCIPN